MTLQTLFLPRRSRLSSLFACVGCSFLAESHSTTTISTKECLRKSHELISLVVQHLVVFQTLHLLATLVQCRVFPVRLCTSFLFTHHYLLLLDVAQILDGGRGIHPDGRPGHELRPGSRQRRHLVVLGEQLALGLALPPDELLDALADEVDHLADAHEDADGGGDHHEEGEDLLLAGARDEAVHRVGARRQRALGEAGHVVAVVDVVEDVEEAGVETRFENQTHLQGGIWGVRVEKGAYFHSREFKITEAEVNLPFHQLNHTQTVLFFRLQA